MGRGYHLGYEVSISDGRDHSKVRQRQTVASIQPPYSIQAFWGSTSLLRLPVGKGTKAHVQVCVEQDAPSSSIGILFR